MAAVQGSLFDTADEVGLRPLDGVRRTALVHGAWLDVLPGWLTGAGLLFEILADTVPWRAERRRMYERIVDVPRLLCHYGPDDPLPHPVLGAARAALSAHYEAERGGPLRTVGLCFYRDGHDSVAWHGDRTGRGATRDTLVAIVSVGEPRVLALRPRDGRAATLRQPLGHGDLVVMGGSCQRTWDHAVPRTAKPVGPRISIQFRPSDVA